jgi:FKBP-type peptidyl-prolyl cis-trans isomerase FklB
MRFTHLAKNTLLAAALCGGGAILSHATAASAEVPLKSDNDKVAYMIGHQIGTNFKRDGIEIDLNIMLAAMKDAIAGTKSQLTPEETQKLMMDFQKSLQAKAEAKARAEGEKNAAAGKTFLAENGKKDGVKTTASGLQYKVVTEGKGEAPKATDTVSVNYKGTLLDGTEFDSSYKRNKPATFAVGGVIKGWTEALQLMKPGSKYELWIPSDLAYGERGAGEQIGPNSTLHFEVELLSIEKKDEKKDDKKSSSNAKPGATTATAPAPAAPAKK